jgi:hypothetical protein
MLIVSLADFTTKVDKYVKTAENEDIIIERDGKPALILSSDKSDKDVNDHRISRNIAAMKSLFGILPPSTTLEDVKNERLVKYS